MRTTASVLITIGLIWIGYIAWPIYDFLVLLRAVETRDVDRVTQHVYVNAAYITDESDGGCVRAAHRNSNQSARANHGRRCRRERRSSCDKADLAQSTV